MKQKIKLIIILSVEFLAIALILLLIFFAGKKSYTITFDLNGGTLLAGNLEQTVTQGNNASPPSVAKSGCYLRGWSGTYTKVTADATVRAIWEYDTTPGIEYTSSGNKNYCEIAGCFDEISGAVYIGAYNGDKKVLGIVDGAFADADRITEVHLLDGIIVIGDRAFENCTSIELIDVPSTTLEIGALAFAGCESLKSITLPDGLEVIGDGAFFGCTALEEIIIPASVKKISTNAFFGCTSLKSVKINTAEGTTLKDGETIRKPVGASAISDGAFFNCTSLETLIIPATVLSVGNDAFSGCESLESVVFETDTNSEGEIEGLLSIGERAFEDCKRLVKITLPASIESVLYGAFGENTHMITIRVMSEDDEPDTSFADGWCSKKAEIKYETIPFDKEKSDEDSAEN